MIVSKARRPKNSWHMVTHKVINTYQMDISYRNTKGDSGPFSDSPQNMSVKIPWGPPISCEFRARKDSRQDELVKEFRFVNRRKETACFSETLLNNLGSNVTSFGQKVTSLVVADRKIVLSNYLTLLQFGKFFIHHNSEQHDDDGFASNGSGVTQSEMEKNGGSLAELRQFVEAAKESAKRVENVDKAYSGMSGAGETKGKRKAADDSLTPVKVSKAVAIANNEKKELGDPTGLEKQLQNSYIGAAWIPLDSITISKELIKVNIFRVYTIIKSMKERYDPSLTTVVVCPENDKQKIDLQNLGSEKFIVVQKVHTISAFKEMGKTGEFKELTGHQGRMVLAYVINTNSPALAHYGNIRSNDITNQFCRKIHPQDLLHVLESLNEKDSSADNLKVIERMCKHCRVNPNEITSVLKLCKWSQPSFMCLMEVVEAYELYKTKDVTASGKYGVRLSRGEKLTMTNALFNSLAKCEESVFQQYSHLVISGEMSLKELVDNNLLNIDLKKVVSVLSQISGYQTIDALKEKYPGKFENLQEFIGAEVKGGKLNQKAIQLDKYYNYVKRCPLESFESPVNFKEISELADMAVSDLGIDNFETVVLNMNGPNQTLCMSIINMVLTSKNPYQACVLIFPDEALHFEVLSFLRSQQISLIKDLKIIPVLFQNEKARASMNGIIENVSYGILFGKLALLLPPFKVLYSDFKQLFNIVAAVAPAATSIAVVTEPGLPIIKVHSQQLQSRILDLRRKFPSLKIC